MPTPVKALENMSKNLTDEERQLREQAEEGVIPDRGRESRMEEPAIMTKNPAARRYWRKVLERMEGLVILDEEQEASYKSENNPRYHARDVAKYRCVQSGALLVMGSATPSVETMYSAQTGRCGLFTLKERFNRRALPQVQVVDMKEELRAGNGRAISRPLQQALEDTLVRGEQAILFLNRRGASRMVSCGECGQVPECPRCSVKLTYHSANGRLMCHHCGFSQPLPRACPECGGKLNFIGFGTQRVQEELEE